MTIEITDRTFGIWMVPLPGGDWLGHLGTDAEGKPSFIYRFRWYKDGKVFEDSMDVKRWFAVTPKAGTTPTVEHMLEVARFSYNQLREKAGTTEGWELLRGERTAGEFMDVLRSLPGMHTKTETVQ